MSPKKLEVEMDISEMCLKCTVDNESNYQICSSEFRLQGGVWKLRYWKLATYYRLFLIKCSGVSPNPLHVSVRVEGFEDGRVVHVLPQERRFTTQFEKRNDKYIIWEKREREILRSLPKFHEHGVLRLIVKLKVVEDVQFMAAQTEDFGEKHLVPTMTSALASTRTSVLAANRTSVLAANRTSVLAANRTSVLAANRTSTLVPTATSTLVPTTASTLVPTTASTPLPTTASTPVPIMTSTLASAAGESIGTASTSIELLNTSDCLASLLQDFSKMLDQGTDTDVEFQCGDHTTRAHGAVVSARSEVIASMLASDMVEGATRVVKIPNMEHEVFKHFLRYIYTGQLPVLTMELALDLYKSGDQYAVLGLAKRCSQYLLEHLSVQNSHQVLIVADTHANAELKQAVIDFMVVNNVHRVSDHWKDFCKAHPMLTIEVLDRSCP